MGAPPPDHTGGSAGVDATRYTQAQGPMPAPLTAVAVVGTNWGPSQLPSHLVTVNPAYVGYQDLFTTLGPTGAPVAATVPGTFGHTTGALLKG
jgi:hypothetical protein